jgi:hypothetical protein
MVGKSLAIEWNTVQEIFKTNDGIQSMKILSLSQRFHAVVRSIVQMGTCEPLIQAVSLRVLEFFYGSHGHT